ncbi:cytokine receptor [Caerostris extrusa]|uniref:Cytokine receptor n=1 Tax=Caerostris extrusa TaxID=172846 RepID=A0AAV4RP74_CAEEX|nr:cytokine receptor [Caerostris extrusa]
MYNVCTLFKICPKPNNNTFASGERIQEPPYQTLNKNLTFRIQGNNSLGFIENEFKFDHFAIVIPNSPENLSAEIGTQSFYTSLAPTYNESILERPFLFYQLCWKNLDSLISKSKIVIDVGVEKFYFTFNNLLPHFKYNVSVRCRTNHSSEDDM